VKNIYHTEIQKEKIMLFKTHPNFKKLFSHKEHKEHKEKNDIV